VSARSPYSVSRTPSDAEAPRITVSTVDLEQSVIHATPQPLPCRVPWEPEGVRHLARWRRV